LDTYLRNQDIKRIYLACFALHVCILATRIQERDLGYQVAVLEDVCASFNDSQRKALLEDIVRHFGEGITVDEFARRAQRI
jgi:nicotinamidase-related amidase